MKPFYTFCICIAILILPHNISIAQTLGEYTLNLNKTGQDEANLHIDCSFTLDFQSADSLALRFGGAEDFSIENMTVQGSDYYYDRASQQLKFYRTGNSLIPVKLSYDYTNLAAFYIYGESNAELWETSYHEFYYPYLQNTYIDMTINIDAPDSLSVICSYPVDSIGNGRYQCILSQVLSQSFSIAFIKKDAYIRSVASIPYEIDIFQIAGMECNNLRYDELLKLTQASISYFSKVYGDEYLSASKNITSYPFFLFHDGKGFSNRYNIGFISASQEKFSTYPDIYPLVHEIGHRWLGEWSLLIDDGEPGAYFIKESLNEFMTLMFLRHHYGNDMYESLIDKYDKEYRTIKNTSLDWPIVDAVRNNNNVVVYNKGPLILDRIARQIGYDNTIRLIAGFYGKHAGKSQLTYSDFVTMISESYPGIEAMLNQNP